MSAPMIEIRAVLERTDLAALIREDLELKTVGAEFVARCPFHEEKTPSFTVSESKRFFHCFGCGAHGDALTWMTEYRGLPFRAALESLAAAAGMDLTPLDNGQARARKGKAVTRDIEAAMTHELHVILSAVGARVAHRAIPAETRARYPHIQPVPDDPWEREFEAARRIAKALYALYGVRAA